MGAFIHGIHFLVGKNGERGAGCGVREGVPQMWHEFRWGMCSDEVEKPVQDETLQAPQVWGAVCEAD